VKLKRVSQYIIPFAGLKEGNHEFSFILDKKFFDEYPLLEARGGLIEALVLLEKQPSLLTLHISLKGLLELECDRCLDFFNFPIDYEGDLIVKFGKDIYSSTDEIWILDPSEYELNMEQYFFESIGMCLPIQRIHPQNHENAGTCNQEMIKLLESFQERDTDQAGTDPRWNILKELLNDTKKN
jgi:uncharacterized metal-binding protein YceD (DUF177 family)